MRKAESIPADKKTMDKIQAAFAAVAEPSAASPTICNRFSVFPSQHGIITVFGGVYAAVGSDGKDIMGASAAASVIFGKNVAEDLIVHLRVAYDISDDDIKNATVRNAGLFEEEKK